MHDLATSSAEAGLHAEEVVKLYMALSHSEKNAVFRAVPRQES